MSLINVKAPNHFNANIEFRQLYYEFQESTIVLSSFLNHIQEFVTNAEEKIGANLKLYSSDFFDFYYAGSYGETFRGSFITTLSSICESYIKGYCKIWEEIMHIDTKSLNRKKGIINYLKEMDEQLIHINIDFLKKEIEDIKGLFAVRNSIVHSSGNIEYVKRQVQQIKRMTKIYPSIQLANQYYILTEPQFCIDGIQIAKSFFYYIFKLAIKNFPNYKEDEPDSEF